MRLIDRRVGWLFLVFLTLLALALARALWLGSVSSGKLKRAAFQEQVAEQPIPAPRGTISDATGVPLALSESVDDIDADTFLIPQAQAQPMARAIAPLVRLPVAKVLTALTKPATGWSPIARQVAPSVAQSILRLQIAGKPINGIYTEPDTKRTYPRGWELAQVLGFVNDWGESESGLERFYNHDLTGTDGESRTVKNPRDTAAPISVRDTRAMTPGRSLRLTVSAPLQDEVEQVLAGIGARYSPVSATAIVTDPRTGAIKALGNWPRIDANEPYGNGASISQVNNAIQDHAVSLTYEPGSTFKAITVAGALQDHLITPKTSFDVPPSLSLYDRTVRDAESHGYENLTTAQILKVSSNIGADLIGRRLGTDRFNDWVHRFGLGRPTGVDLPGEDAGWILEPSQYSGTSMLNLPFGQGESVTPMQMATAYDAIANGGILRPTHIVSAIGAHAQPIPHGHRIISSSTAGELRNMLRGVLGEGGTASGADIPGYDLAGKTGTANVAIDGRYSDTEYVASFIGMVPASNPKLVVTVVVDEPKGGMYGGSVAAPAFQKIVGWAVPYYGINPDPAHVRQNP